MHNEEYLETTENVGATKQNQACTQLGGWQAAHSREVRTRSKGDAMQTTLRIETTVLPGNRVEFTAPELPEGAHVEVTVVVPNQPARRLSMLEFLKTLPPGPLVFAAPADVDRYLQEERDAWDR